VWEISILIEGPSGPGEIAFLERVLKPATISPLLSVGAPFGGLIILGIVFYWLQRQSERDEKASA
jgi:hypothetical protein